MSGGSAAASPRRAVLWVGTTLGLGAVVLMLVLLGPRDVLEPLLRSRPDLLAGTAVLLAAVQSMNAATPALLVRRADGEPVTWWSRTRVFLATQPLALFAPGRLSDLGAVPLLRKHHPPGATASAIVVDRLLTVLFLLLLAPLAIHHVLPGTSGAGIYVAVGASLLVVVSVPFFLLHPTVRDLANRTVLRLSPGLLAGFGDHLEDLLRNARVRLAVNLGLTALKTLASGAVITLLAANVGLSIGVATAFWIAVLTQLATAVPVSIQGIGVAEGALVLLLGVNGHPEALALSMGVTARLLFIPVYGLIFLTVTLPLLSDRVRGGRDAARRGDRDGSSEPRG